MKCHKKKRVLWKNLFYMGAVVTVLLTAMAVTGCGRETVEKITCSDTAMGTVIQQTLYVRESEDREADDREADDRGEEGREAQDDADALPARVMDCLNDLEAQILSWRLEGTEVYEINQSDPEAGYPLSEKMSGYLECISQVWEKSGGALDVTLGEVTRLWNIDAWAQGLGAEKETTDETAAGSEDVTGKDAEAPTGDSDELTSGQQEDVTGQQEFQLPAQTAIVQALEHTGFEKLRIAENRIYLPEGMSLDLGAVGKGIACDEILALLETQEQVQGAVISVGGSVLTYGSKPDGNCWKVGIQHPRESGEYLAILSLPGSKCVSTSGDYERYVELEGIRYHHIMDPETGYPADSGLISATIVSDSGLLSDALSTACFVLGAEKGLALAESFGVEAYLIGKDMEIYMTEGMKALILR